MPYTAHHLYSRTDATAVRDTITSRKLSADSDVGAIAEADIWLRSSRVVARVLGDEPPVAEVIWKDGQVLACVRHE
jgi:hypothetical protein